MKQISTKHLGFKHIKQIDPLSNGFKTLRKCIEFVNCSVKISSISSSKNHFPLMLFVTSTYTISDLFGRFLFFCLRLLRLYRSFSTSSYAIPSILLLFRCFQWSGVPRVFKTAKKYCAIRSSPTTESFTDPVNATTKFTRQNIHRYVLQRISYPETQ